MNTKPIVTLLTVCIAGSSMFLAGCSKSKNASNSSAGSSANGGSGPAGPIALKINWQAGKQYNMEMDLNQSSDISIPNQPIHQILKLSQGFHYSPVKALDNGGNQVKMEFDHQNLNLTQNGRDLVSYDSDDAKPARTNSPAAAVGAVMRAMLGVPIIYTIGADGKVENIDGIDTLMSRIKDAMPNDRQRSQLNQLFDEGTLKRYGSLSEGLPNHPVNVGDSWSSSQDINNQTGVMTVDANYTFKDWEQHNGHNCAHIVFTGDIKTKEATASALGAVVNVKKGTINGESWFDPDLGMYQEINSDQDLTMNIKTQTMTMTDRMKQTVAISLVDVDQ